MITHSESLKRLRMNAPIFMTPFPLVTPPAAVPANRREGVIHSVRVLPYNLFDPPLENTNECFFDFVRRSQLGLCSSGKRWTVASATLGTRAIFVPKWNDGTRHVFTSKTVAWYGTTAKVMQLQPRFCIDVLTRILEFAKPKDEPMVINLKCEVVYDYPVNPRCEKAVGGAADGVGDGDGARGESGPRVETSKTTA